MVEAAETETLRRVLDGLNNHLQPVLAPFVSQTMEAHFGPNWLENASCSRGGSSDALDLHGQLKTILDKWLEVFRKRFSDRDVHRVRGFVSTAFEARNTASHPVPPISAKAGLRYLDAMHELAKCLKVTPSEIDALERLYDEQLELTAAPPRRNERPVLHSEPQWEWRGSQELANFRNHLVTDYQKVGTGGPLSPGSADSYCEYVAGIEGTLKINLKDEDLGPAGVAMIERRLRSAKLQFGIADKTISNWISGLRAYARYKRSA